MSRLGVLYFRPIHCGPFERSIGKSTSREFFILSLYPLGLLDENVPAGVFLYPRPVHFSHFGRNPHVPSGPFGRKRTGWGFCILGRYILYGLGVLHSQTVYFGHLGQKCTCWQFLVLRRYMMPILQENMAAGGVLLSAGTFWPVWAKMYRLGIFCSQPGHFWQLGAKMYRLGIFYSKRGKFWPSSAKM